MIKRTAWQIACAWYSDIGRALKNPDNLAKIPNDHTSPEFAEWLTEQYRLAMAKGIELGRSGELDDPSIKI